MASVLAMKIENKLEEEVFRAMTRKVQQDKRDRIGKFYRWQDAYLTLFGDLLVRMELLKYSNFNNTDIYFSSTEFGKPAIAGCAPFRFNISHSGNWIVCIVDTRDVGIDIEKIEEVELSVAEDYFSREEYHDIINSKDPKTRFIEYWTLKESYIKYVGKGLSMPLNSFCIKFEENDRITVSVDGTLLKGLNFKQYDVAEGYKMAVCNDNSDLPAHCTIYSMEDVIKIMQHVNNLC
jgi:4'-phosphopantetheinyl transferase